MGTSLCRLGYFYYHDWHGNSKGKRRADEQGHRQNAPFQLRQYTDRIYEIKAAEGTHGGANPNICKDFVDMILYGKEPVATPLAGRMSVAVGCADTESIRSGGRVVEVAPIPDFMKEGR